MIQMIAMTLKMKSQRERLLSKRNQLLLHQQRKPQSRLIAVMMIQRKALKKTLRFYQRLQLKLLNQLRKLSLLNKPRKIAVMMTQMMTLMRRLSRSQLPRKARSTLNLMMTLMKIQVKKKNLKPQLERHQTFQMEKVNKLLKKLQRTYQMMKKKKRKKEEMMKKELRLNCLLET